jgi:hypothetical protein
MTTLKLIAAGLIVAATLATPAIAREGSARMRASERDAYAAAVRNPAAHKRGCVRAPDIGAFATAPWRKPPCEPASTY